MIDVLMPKSSPRLEKVLDFALKGIDHVFVQEPQRNRRVLFALTTDSYGMTSQALDLLRYLRQNPTSMEGSYGSVIVDGESELYTKELGQSLCLGASMAGCAFPGKPLIEGTASLYNQHIMAEQWGLSVEETYFRRCRELVLRLADYEPPKFQRPKILVLHASERGRSGTLWLGDQLCEKLSPYCDIREVSLRNGTIHDCRGCSYSACLHFSKNEGCFYGGAIAETVLPAIQESNVLLFLCPNYNDSVSANVLALFNRLTSYLLHSHLYEKYLYGIVVSGYSGSDLVARQLLGAMCLNKTAQLPPHFCMMQTANDLKALQALPAIQENTEAFAQNILKTILQPKPIG